MELDKIKEPFDENRVYVLQRDDERAISVTRDKFQIPRMISDEFCGVEVRIDEVIFNKHPMNYTIKATLFDDGDENEYEFTLEETVFY